VSLFGWVLPTFALVMALFLSSAVVVVSITIGQLHQTEQTDLGEVRFDGVDESGPLAEAVVAGQRMLDLLQSDANSDFIVAEILQPTHVGTHESKHLVVAFADSAAQRLGFVAHVAQAGMLGELAGRHGSLLHQSLRPPIRLKNGMG